ncbi:MAG: hypothetical protein D6758_01635 [Gammaproteobacteria bacterium]|nr:MAG: hypothetical protein D6758_01635 [Gammaproteobacteria bacterium]
MQASELERLFNDWARPRWQTRLAGGYDEPLYLPVSETGAGEAEIRYREDSVNSALHEIAHWMIAGARRRQQVDYGYWYAPDGRDAAQQAEFERLEVRPQALEWWMAEKLGVRFWVSADNLAAGIGPSPAFCESVAREAARMAAGEGIPPRARDWVGHLERHGYAQRVLPALFTTKRL